MKKFFSKNILSFALVIAMVCALAIQPMTAFAAEDESIKDRISATEQAVTELEWSTTDAAGSKAHVTYYPYAGSSSGSFYGENNSNPPKYSGLPSNKRLYISYCMDGGGTFYLLFHSGTSTSGSAAWSLPLTADDYAHESYIDLPSYGTYTVEVYVPGNVSQRIFAFTLYTK